MSTFHLKSPFEPTGDQPQAIERLVEHLRAGARHQTLVGVTGSGKTFSVANVIERLGKPALVISHNKTLAAQLYEEFKQFFPENAVHYFVSYYDYYQPEAYIPQTDTYIEKDSKINDLIDALRHAATASLLTRRDTIIVASVSCIYGVGNPEEYSRASLDLRIGQKLSLKTLTKHLVMLQYVRNPLDPRQGHFRLRDNNVEIYLPSGEDIINVEILDGKINTLVRKSAVLIQNTKYGIQATKIFPAKHFVTPQERIELALANIRAELDSRLKELKQQGKELEAYRLNERTKFDIEMIRSNGYCSGIENYSRHLDFREPGSPPHTLIDYFRYAHGDEFLTFIDESHVTIPQLRGMYFGDRSRKQTLIDYGFRLPSALDNRPLKFEEFNKKVIQLTYVSATPGQYELMKSAPHSKEDTSSYIVQQIIRPTGIVDPRIEIRPTEHQIRDVIKEVKARIAKGERSLVMALTKRLAEDIADYLKEGGINAEYLHSEIKTLERPGVLKRLRTGEHDVIVGINLLREGIDLPEVSFIAILDADKEGFLRNETTLLQIIGRAARHVNGCVFLYADTMTGSMHRAIRETDRRRRHQQEYNRTHGITPTQITREIRPSILGDAHEEEPLPQGPAQEIIKDLRREMKKAAKEMDFERAAKIRDRIKRYSTPN